MQIRRKEMNEIYKCDKCGKDTTNRHDLTLNSGRTFTSHICDDCRRQIDREYDWINDNAHEYENHIICPYCDYNYDDYDSYACWDGDDSEVECLACGKTFSLKVRQIIEFSTYKSAEEMPKEWEAEE
jgi:DNA-directed RNA polymerase subunit RPC12/RpoP